ncbi:MAG: TonB family protein [Arcobacteraceae bacterium]|nr:TonB family protein [Arcobacteraceae bacterium]
MNRYFSSFLITAFLYIILIASYLYSLDNQKIIKSVTKKSEQTVKFTVIVQQRPQPEPKKIEKPKPKPKPIVKPKPKPKPKPIVKPKPKPKPKPIEKPKPKPKPKPIVKPKPKPIEKPKEIIKKEYKKQIVQKTQIKQNKSVVKKAIDTLLIEKQTILRNQYYTKIKNTINKNKSYPKIAIRRGIQGEVKIKFTISPKGELISYKIIEGKKIFKKSVVIAIKNSFPLEAPKGLFKNNLDLFISIKYNLH